MFGKEMQMGRSQKSKVKGQSHKSKIINAD
jgi:hypothetical protein